MCPFGDTANKTEVRQSWDRPVLERWRNTVGSPLTYFGLSGPEMRDLLDWRDLLGRTRTSVEGLGDSREERQQTDDWEGDLAWNAFGNRLGSGLQVLRGDIEQIVLDGVDVFNIAPLGAVQRPGGGLSFTYDLINLDFDGGLGYPASGGVRRVNAIKRLFELQEGRCFVLLLTINVRDRLGPEVENSLTDLLRLSGDGQWQTIVEWYQKRGKGDRQYKLKVVVPPLVKAAAEARSYHCVCRPPVFYIGHERARMLHFVFELTCAPGLRGISDQGIQAMVRLPLIECEDGRLRVSVHQHPGLTAQDVRDALAYLPETTRETILMDFAGRNG